MGSSPAIARKSRSAVAVLPAIVVVPATWATPSRTSISMVPNGYRPSTDPAAAIASVTATSRCGGERRVEPGAQVRVDVHAVADELERHGVVLEQGEHGARVAVVQRTHRVEQVGGVAGTGGDGGARRRAVGVGVADRGDGAEPDDAAYGIDAARELGREGHHAHGVVADEVVDLVGVRGPADVPGRARRSTPTTATDPRGGSRPAARPRPAGRGPRSRAAAGRSGRPPGSPSATWCRARGAGPRPCAAASGSAPKEAPPPPWQCRSTNPGTSTTSPRSRTRPAAGSGAARPRPAPRCGRRRGRPSPGAGRRAARRRRRRAGGS